MRCPVCGRENNNGNKFCDSCGARLVGGNSPKPSKNRAVLLAIVSVLVIILLGECAYLLVLKLKQKPSSTAAATTAVSAEVAPSASATNKPVTTQEKPDPGQKSEPGKSEDPGQKATQEPVVKTQEEKEPKTDPNTETVSEPKPSEPEHEPPKDEPDKNANVSTTAALKSFIDYKNSLKKKVS